MTGARGDLATTTLSPQGHRALVRVRLHLDRIWVSHQHVVDEVEQRLKLSLR